MIKDISNPITDYTGGIEVTEGVVILLFVMMIATYFIRDREELLTEIEMMVKLKRYVIINYNICM